LSIKINSQIEADKTKLLDTAGLEQEVNTEVNHKTVITAVTLYCNCCLVISAADLLLYWRNKIDILQ